MNSSLARKLRTLLLLCLLTSFAGIIYQLIAEQHLNFASVTFGLPLGLAFGTIELFLFPRAEKRFRRWNFTRLLIFKAITYTAVIYLVSLGITTVVGMVQGRNLNELVPFLKSPEPYVLLL